MTECRSEKVDPTTGVMDYLNKIPRFVSKAAIHILMWLDKHGWVPKDIIATDPYYNSVVISNLGSIKLKCWLSPPDQLGHLLPVLHHRREEAVSLL